MANDDLRARAEAWLADDPDPAARDEIRELLAGLPATTDELTDRFSGTLTFGTAGLRGELRAGPNGMNLAVVSRAAAGLVAWLAAQDADGPLVIGYDARHGSQSFAEQTARIATGAGREALLLPRPLPTPVLAYAVRALHAAAGVMVTASHNPPQDNGYKVYLGSLGGSAGTGAQIVPPADAEIEAAIQAVTSITGIKLGDPGRVLDETIVAGYVGNVGSLVSWESEIYYAGDQILEPAPGDLRIAYTPLHGVGGSVLREVFEQSGFDSLAIVAEQAEPDPDFPTVKFPNPEEPGAMDALLALATETRADLAIANDPDADRCAIAIPRPDGSWQPLTGDQLGVLLADQLISRRTAGTFATTIVSSTMLKAMCAARGVPYAETLTGFKWIVRGAEELAYGYEEALGYCVAPDVVRDKDGISAALLVAALATRLRLAGQTIADRLDALDTTYGVHKTAQVSMRVNDLTKITETMAAVRADPPKTLLGEEITEVEDLLPDADVLTLRTASTRVVIRPSGTEPKLKAYLETVVPVADGDLTAARDQAETKMQTLRAEISAALGL